MVKGAKKLLYGCQMTILETEVQDTGEAKRHRPDIAESVKKADAPKVTDPFGRRIGGARKELWRGRGLKREDIAMMNRMEREKYVRKDSIWKRPDYNGMVESGIPVEVVYAVKKIRDGIMPRIPESLLGATKTDALQVQEEYITFCSEVRDMAMGLATVDDLYDISDNFLVRQGYIGIGDIQSPFLDKKLFSAMVINASTVRKYQRQIRKSGFGTTDRKKCTKTAKRKAAFVPEQLGDIERTGLDDVRNGSDMTGRDFIDTFRIRGGEFGNWLNEKDAQASLNMAYEAMSDYAGVLKILPEQVSFSGRLSIAFGARGVGKAAAHYEPMREVINLTKMNGAGSLGHELFHALDDIIGKRLGLDGMMTRETKNKRAVPYSVRRLITAMCYRDETPEEQAERMEEKYEDYCDDIKSTIDRIFADGSPSVTQSIKIERIVKALADQTRQKIKDVGADNCKIEAADCSIMEELSQLKKEVTGQELSESDENMLNTVVIKYSYILINGYREGCRKVYTDYYMNSKKMDRVHSKDSFGYWSSFCEMFARAGACYLHDRLEESGGRSDYLCGHSETCISVVIKKDGGSEIITAMPMGDERKNISLAMEEMITDLRERGLFLTEEERAHIVRDSAKACLENGQVLAVSFGSNQAVTEDCDACIAYDVYDSDGTLADGGEMDYSSEEFSYSDVALFIPRVIDFHFDGRRMDYMLMDGGIE